MSSAAPAGRSIFSRFLASLNSEHIVQIPTIVKGPQEIEAMVAIRSQIQFGRNIVLDFASCGKLSLNAMVFLGALASLVRHHRGSIGVGPTIKPKLLKELREHGIMGHFGDGDVTSGLPFGHYASIDKSAIMQFLQEKWLGVICPQNPHTAEYNKAG